MARRTWDATVAAELPPRLHQHVDRLAGLIGPRHLERAWAFDAAATYIEHALAALPGVLTRHAYDIGPHCVANLVLERRGTVRPEQILVVGAHYDTVPGTPGADDNASAVAVLLETARILQDRVPQATIRFVAFPCEEPPYFYTQEMGSQQYAAECRARSEQLIGMLCLEMVGYYSNQSHSQQIPEAIPRWLRFAFPHRGNFLAAVSNPRSWRLLWGFRRGFKRATSFPLFTIPLPERVVEIRLSDNSSFWDQGFPALMITDTSFLRNPHYHRPSDLPETLDYECMAQVTLGVAGAILHLAGGDAPP